MGPDPKFDVISEISNLENPHFYVFNTFPFEISMLVAGPGTLVKFFQSKFKFNKNIRSVFVKF